MKYQFSLLEHTERVVDTLLNTDLVVGLLPLAVDIDGFNYKFETPKDSLFFPKYFSSSICSFFSFLFM